MSNDPPADGRPFPAARDEFYSRLVRDRSLTATDLRVAWALLAHVNSRSLLAWPSHTRLAKALGKHDPADPNRTGERMVRRALKKLVERGYFEVIERGGAKGRGAKEPTVYRPVFVGTEESLQQLPLWGPDSPVCGDSGVPFVGSEESPKPKKEPQREPLKKKRANTSQEPTTLDQQFENWWSQFPRGRKNAKAKARKKYSRIINTGTATPQELLAGVMRYSAAIGDDHEFVCMPITWLNGARWNDEDPGGPPSKGKGSTGRPDLAHTAMNLGRKPRVH